MHEICGALSMPVSSRVSKTVSRVRSRVLPPAPKVTEKNSGFSAASLRRVVSSRATASGVRGGKNSKLTWPAVSTDLSIGQFLSWGSVFSLHLTR